MAIQTEFIEKKKEEKLGNNTKLILLETILKPKLQFFIN